MLKFAYFYLFKWHTLYSIKDLCGWYGRSPKTIRKKLVKYGVISPDDHKRGCREPFEFNELIPVFNALGYPKDLKVHQQLSLFNRN